MNPVEINKVAELVFDKVCWYALQLYAAVCLYGVVRPMFGV